MKIRIVLLLLTVLFVFGCANKKEKEFLVVGVNEMFPPFGYKGGESGEEMVGFDIELAKEIAKDLDLTLTLVPMKFNEILVALQDGKIDVALSAITITPERSLAVDFSTPYYHSTQSIVVKADNHNFNDLHEIEQIIEMVGQLGAERGSTGSVVAKQISQGRPILEINSLEIMFLELLSGNIDAIVMDREIARASAAKYKNLRVLNMEFEEEHYGAAVRKGDKELLKSINHTLARLINSGQYMNLVQEYIKAY